MTVVAEEMFRARRGDAYSSRERDYLCIGTDGDAMLEETAAITAAVATSPNTITAYGGIELYRNNASIGRHISNDRMVVSVQYGAIGYSGAATVPGTVEYEFNYQAPSMHVNQSLATVAIYDPAGVVSEDVFNGAIGVNRNSDGAYDVEGVDLAPGATTNSVGYTVAAEDVFTTAYEMTIENLCGTVNSAIFKTRPIGSMRLVNVASTLVGGGKAHIRFGFQFEQNVPPLPTIVIGEISIAAKRGHDYLWVYRDLEKFDTKKLVLPKPKAVIISQIHRYADFAGLGIGT